MRQTPEILVTAEGAVALLRRVADQRDAWAEAMAADEGEQSVQFARQESMWFRTAANLTEEGEYRGFSYAPG